MRPLRSTPRVRGAAVLRRSCAALGALAASMFVLAGPAAAAPDSLSVTLSSQTAANGGQLTATFAGSDSTYDAIGDTPELYALVRPSNGIPCQATFGQDEAVAGTADTTELYSQDNNADTVPAGPFSYPTAFTAYTGSNVVCAWLETDDADAAGKGDVASQVVTATAGASFTGVSTDRLTVSLPTTMPSGDGPFTITLAGSDSLYDAIGDTPELYALVRPSAGVPCQATFGQDEQVAGTAQTTALYDAGNNGSTVPLGGFSYRASVTPAAGTFVVCAWLEADAADHAGKADVASQVVTATATATFKVAEAPPAQSSCKVPALAGLALPVAEKRIRRDHCTVGAITYAHSDAARDVVIASKPGAGTTETGGSAVALEVSDGPRHHRRRHRRG